MSRTRLALVFLAAAGVAFVAARSAPKAAPPAAAAPAGNCKTFGTGRCCDPAVAAHLTKDAIFGACGKSEAVFLGEQGSKETCKYFFKVEGEKDQEMYVQVYAPAVKGTPPLPADPFVTWKKVAGSVMMAEPKSLKGATNPKVKAMAGDTSGAVGLWMPGNGYYVMVSSSSKICSKADAKRLATSLR